MALPVGNTLDRPLSPPHLVSLVLQSKKGLQHGKQLCSRAHDLTNDSARNAIDVLALDSKIQWITEGILDQLKVAVGVAKSINERRMRLEEEAKHWDRIRAQHQEALDNTLESLGAQVVPPSFHQSSLESSLFGIQVSDNQEGTTDEGDISDNAAQGNDTHQLPHNRHKWKTLRDFVDERGLEDVFESIEGERGALDETLAATVAHASDIMTMTDRIRVMLSNPASVSQESLPNRKSPRNLVSPVSDRKSLVDKPPLKNMTVLLQQQEDTSTTMANHLESLAIHYDQMATALKEKEAGEEFGEEDMEVFVRDTAELPAIITDLEESITSIEAVFDEIMNTKNNLQASLATRSRVLDSLDFLGDKMESMLQEQSDIELETQTTYQTLNDYLESLMTLRSTYETYQLSYNALVLEMDRRRHYRDSIEAIIQEMRERLRRVREDEILMRDTFYLAHSASIPDDLCLAISNIPESFIISSSIPHNEHGNEQDNINREVLPEIQEDLLAEARRRLEAVPLQHQHMGDALDTPVRPAPRGEDSL